MPKKRARSADTPWLQVGAGLLGRVTSAFAPKVARRQTDIMEKAGVVSMSAADLRARVNDLADRVAGRLERTADRISAETRDPTVRRRALAFKVDAIPAVYTAAYRVDPQVAAADTWALAFQVRECVETGAGRDAFGAQQPFARAEARDLLAEADASVQGMTASQKAFDAARVKVQSGSRSIRSSMRSLRARPSPRSWPSGGPRIGTPSSPWERSRTRSRTSRNA